MSKMMRVDYIGATWCKVCHVVQPQVEKLAKDFGFELNVLDADELGDETIMKVPTVRVYEGNELKQTIVTKHVEALKELLAVGGQVVLTDDF